MNKEQQNAGFIPPVITADHYVLGDGNVPLDIIQLDSDWTDSLPEKERQRINGVETYNCTGFGTLNSIETLIYKITGERVNYSDRFLGIVAGTHNPGNDPHVVAEAIRKYGLIPESMLPFSSDITSEAEYYSFKGADKDACYAEGRKWLAKYDFKHDWAFTPGQPIIEQLKNMKIALQNSPLSMSVYAWASNDKDIYYALGQPNHWVMNFMVDNYMHAFDTYDPFLKLLEQNIVYCKRYSIRLRKDGEVTPEQAVGLWAQILKLLQAIGILQKEVANLPKQSPPLVVVSPPVPPVTNTVEPVANKLNAFCMAIQTHEGWFNGSRSQRNNNPGNCKFSTVGYLPKYKTVRQDDNGFAIFQTYELGFLYLQNLVINKANKHPDWDFYQFFGDEKDGWAPASDNNDAKRYAFVVATACGVDGTARVKPLLLT